MVGDDEGILKAIVEKSYKFLVSVISVTSWIFRKRKIPFLIKAMLLDNENRRIKKVKRFVLLPNSNEQADVKIMGLNEFLIKKEDKLNGG